MYKPFDLTGKVALVTGGNGGIGLGMADAMAHSGADIVIWGTNEAKNDASVKSLLAHGKRVSARKVNVANEQEVIDGMKAAIAEMGRLDCVVANAGIGGGAPIHEMTTDLFRKVNAAVNTEGVMWTFREAAKHMIDRAKDGDAQWFAACGRVHRRHRGRGEKLRLRSIEGRGDVDGTCTRGRAGALWRARELHRAGLDRDRHDGRRAEQPRLR